MPITGIYDIVGKNIISVNVYSSFRRSQTLFVENNLKIGVGGYNLSYKNNVDDDFVIEPVGIGNDNFYNFRSVLLRLFNRAEFERINVRTEICFVERYRLNGVVFLTPFR